MYLYLVVSLYALYLSALLLFLVVFCRASQFWHLRDFQHVVTKGSCVGFISPFLRLLSLVCFLQKDIYGFVEVREAGGPAFSSNSCWVN